MSHTNIANEVGEKLRDILDDGLSTGQVDFVCDFDDSAGSKFARGVLIRFEEHRRFFHQERMLNFVFRCQATNAGNLDPSPILDILEETLSVLRDNLLSGDVYQGLVVGDARRIESSLGNYKFVDLPVSALRVHDSPLQLELVNIEQRFFADSIDSATMTPINAGSSTLANLQDRDPATKGFDELKGASVTTGFEMDLGSSRACDTIAIDMQVNKTVTFTFYRKVSGVWTLTKTGTITDTSRKVFRFTFSEFTEQEWKVEFITTAASTQIDAYFVFLGVEYEIPKTYDIVDSASGSDTPDPAIDISVSANLDQITAFRLAEQSSGVEQKFWDVVWGVRKSVVNAMIAELLKCEFDQKPFLFFDTYRHPDYLLVQMQDLAFRVNQILEDYYRAKFQFKQKV